MVSTFIFTSIHEVFKASSVLLNAITFHDYGAIMMGNWDCHIHVCRYHRLRFQPVAKRKWHVLIDSGILLRLCGVSLREEMAVDRLKV